METEPSSPALHEAQAQGQRETKRARGIEPKPNVVPERSMVPEPTVLLEPEDVPIPDADDLVIALLADQMVDVDESSTIVLETFVATGGDNKRDDG